MSLVFGVMSSPLGSDLQTNSLCHKILSVSTLIMCILFLLIGDECHPTIVCNNRDEYLSRSTVRGSLIHNGNTYCPVDKVGGGSWISFSGLNENRLKFAVVLNYHYWRQPNVVPIMNEEVLKSRGLLIKNFMENSIESLTYAQSIYDSRAEYRPFNLIVGMSAEICITVDRDVLYFM